MGAVDTQRNKLGRLLMLGARESGKLMLTIQEYFKIYIGNVAQGMGTGLMKINSLTDLVYRAFSSQKTKKNIEPSIHYRTYNPALKQTYKVIILACFLLLAYSFVAENLSLVYASEINVSVLADAIRKAEGNPNYGVLSIPCKTEAKCRQICINSIKNNLKRYEKSDKSTDFISFMAKRWCPIGAENDPSGLNKNWAKNTSFFYARLLAKKSPTLKKFNGNVNYRL